MKIRTGGVDSFHAGVWTDMTNLTVVFRNLLGAPNRGVKVSVLECDNVEQPPLLIQHFIRAEITELGKLTEARCFGAVVPTSFHLCILWQPISINCKVKQPHYRP
jgi:hypothetical protein